VPVDLAAACVVELSVDVVGHEPAHFFALGEIALERVTEPRGHLSAELQCRAESAAYATAPKERPPWSESVYFDPRTDRKIRGEL
jgi:hypothetical protein